jgi:hypothetical protein
MVQTVIPMPGTLRILRSSAELPPGHEFGAETVVLDLPADIRLAARAEVRKRYSGRLLVALSSEAEAEGWPDDPACRFLVRPFRVEEVGEALRAPVPEADSAASAALPARRRPAEIGAATAPRALSARPGAPGAPFTDAPASQANAVDQDRARDLTPAVVAEPEPRLRRRRGGRRGLLAILVILAMAAVAAFGGVAIGRTSVDLENRSGSGSTTPGRAAPPAAPPSTAARSSQAAACADAMDQADAAISYLVAGIHDERLSKAMQQYRDDRRICQGKAAG